MRTIHLLGLGVCLLLAFSCKKDDDPSNCTRLEGTWQGQSWTEEGVQLLGPGQIFTAADLTFKPLISGQGDYILNLTFLIGGSEMVIGAYTVNEGCNSLSLTPKNGPTETYDFHFEGDDLVLEGTGAQAQIIIHLE